jgi:biopolymer transport protein ExbD
MTFRTYTRIVEGRIDPAPMVDVVFLLLIFIILSSPFVLQTGQGLDLPKDPDPTAFSFQTMVLTVSRDNLLFFNGQAVTLDGLRSALGKEARLDRKAELIVKADRQVTHEMMMKIVSVAREVGIQQINLATRPGVPAAAPKQ